jgi:2-methylcitrate dehydratase PrpD
MRRDGEAIRDALILATAQTVARPDRNVSRWSLLGRAAAAAVATCQLTALPTGDPQALGSWARTQGFTFAPATLASRAARIGQVDIKLFPTARQGLSAISAFRRLSAHTPPGKHDRVIVAVPGIYAAMIGGSGLPTNRIESLLRVSYQLALAALYPDRLFDVTRVDLPVGEEIQQFLARVSIVADPRFDALYPRSWAGEVRLGTTAVETVHDPEGSALAGFGWPELNAKALRLARANHIAPGRFKALEQLIREEGSPQAILTLILGD